MAKKKKNQQTEVNDNGAVDNATDAQVNKAALSAIRNAASEFALFADQEILADDEAETNENNELAEFEATGIFTEEEATSFLPEGEEMMAESDSEMLPQVESVEGTELDGFEAASIEELEFVEDERLDSILESIFFASDRPVSMNSLKLVFKGTNIKGDKLRRSLDRLAVELASGTRGITLEEVPGGFQLRTKIDNMQFLTRTLKARPFKLSGPALEVLAIVAYKQPVIKHEIDEIRGVESGHLLRALMEKGLVNFEGKSDLPGKPMNYATTKKFLEIFGLRNLKELPTLSQIDELLPEGMTEEEAKPTLGQVSDSLAQTILSSYSEGEDELMKISSQLDSIATSSDFFEQEKVRQRQKRDEEKAQNIREALAMDEAVSNRDKNWLQRYDEALLAGTADQFSAKDAVAIVAVSDEVEGLAFAEENTAADAESETDSTEELLDYEVADIDADETSEDEESSGETSGEAQV